MQKVKNFIKTSLLGGVTVILPLAITLIILRWIFNFVTGLLDPFTGLIVARADIKKIIADIIVMSAILIFCFIVGALVKTGVGRFFHGVIEKRIFSIAPGYNLIRETILQLLGGKKAPFSQVVLVELSNSGTLVTGFITDDNESVSDYVTVFIPTAPTPAGGMVFHIHRKYVHKVDVSMEQAMRSVITCGVGSHELLAKCFRNK
ncbi:MAG: DUF502 domain-containing protein [Candidatus Omnitrophica bacterium]|nr:DUF502 domain-containing protein [Candidatus Omnitrophota bacterium]